MNMKVEYESQSQILVKFFLTSGILGVGYFWFGILV